MLRKIIMSLGVFIAVLPYLGFPHSVNNWLYSIAGLLIFFLLVFSKKTKHIRVPIEQEGVSVPIASNLMSHHHNMHRDKEEVAEEVSRELPVEHKKEGPPHHVELTTPEMSVVGMAEEHDASRESLSPAHRPKTKRKKRPETGDLPEGGG